MPKLIEVFSNNLRNKVRLAGLSQPDFASKLDSNINTVKSWMYGKAWPHADAIDSMAEILGVSSVELLSNEIPTNNSNQFFDRVYSDLKEKIVENEALKNELKNLQDRFEMISETMAAIEDLEKIAPHLRKYIIAASKNTDIRNRFTAILGSEALGERTGDMQDDEIAVFGLMAKSGAFDEPDKAAEKEKNQVDSLASSKLASNDE